MSISCEFFFLAWIDQRLLSLSNPSILRTKFQKHRSVKICNYGYRRDQGKNQENERVTYNGWFDKNLDISVLSKISWESAELGGLGTNLLDCSCFICTWYFQRIVEVISDWKMKKKKFKMVPELKKSQGNVNISTKSPTCEWRKNTSILHLPCVSNFNQDAQRRYLQS